MNFFTSQTKQKTQPSPKHNNNNNNKKRLTQDQVKLLEASFESNKKLDPERKFQLARDLGVPPRQIAIWYQNRRARWKNQSLELDYSALQVKLESALAEKRHLEREMGKLKEELKRAEEMLVVGGAAASSSQGMSSASFQDEGLLQFEELYASLVGAEGGTNITNSSSSWANGNGFWV